MGGPPIPRYGPLLFISSGSHDFDHEPDELKDQGGFCKH